MKLFTLPQNKAMPAGRQGFTLIELLIVIALLGALAVGLLATIDPFEQLKKGRDTSLRNTVSEFYNSNLRYYSIKSAFPWNTAGGVTSYVGSSLTATAMSSAIEELATSGELKARFQQLAGTANLAKIFVTSTAADQIAVCFMPESKSFQKDNNTIYNQTAAVHAGPPACSSQTSTGGTSCYFCVQ